MVESSLTSEYRSINIFINFCRDPKYKYKVPRTNFSLQSKEYPGYKEESSILVVTTS
ncbi:hypothetical protein LguiA_004922 [Lonicera macranthoides]